MANQTTQSEPPAPNTISLRAPSKYSSDASKAPTTTSGEPFVTPPLAWLWRTWSVTHSTLSMWRSAKNVRITYKPLSSPPDAATATTANDNLVEYEKSSGKGGVKSVAGVEKPDANIPGAWNWRGKGLLAIASSHWEVLGWGEREILDGVGEERERWAVTWFAPTLFTQEGVDIYSDRKEGLSKETVDGIMKALRELKDAPKVVEMVEKSMQEVEITLPWQEK
ncbi:Uu.00g070780.m01.CDS01 [Anthostomella pinea]|uniref:Uu.00g070780.m01.CDS01 n=1 Tax=Anthostomella pinea TaxID=933095 RepID=A0AAI8VUS4_9PEZI|nr:Uu.00g070780.m01.CDS01 [Anthostomella pinea]